MVGCPQHCVTSSAELCLWACEDLFPPPLLSVPCCLLVVKRPCPLGQVLVYGHFARVCVCPASRPLCPLPGHIQPVQEERAASFFVWVCFLLSS